METSRHNIERATNGLVTALFLAAALFLFVVGMYLLRDFEERDAEPASDDLSSAVLPAPTPPLSPSLSPPPTSFAAAVWSS